MRFEKNNVALLKLEHTAWLVGTLKGRLLKILSTNPSLNLIWSLGTPQAMGVSWKRPLGTYAPKPMDPWI